MKELSVPFNLIDFFAYLGNGLAAIALLYATLHVYYPSGVSRIVSYLAGLDVIITTPLVVFASYAVGQAAAHISDILFERLIVGRALGHPRRYLLGAEKKKAGGFWRKAIVVLVGSPNYLQPLPDSILDVLKERYEARYSGHLSDCQEAERLCFSVVNEKQKKSSGRIEVFLAIYTFCRNASLILACCALAVYRVAGARELPLVILLVSLSLLLFGRYLNFLRFYTRDIFISFLSEPTKDLGVAHGRSA